MKASRYSGVLSSYFCGQQWLAFLHISNALLVNAVNVKIQLGDNIGFEAKRKVLTPDNTGRGF